MWPYTHILELMAIQGFDTIFILHKHFEPRNVKTHCLSQLQCIITLYYPCAIFFSNQALPMIVPFLWCRWAILGDMFIENDDITWIYFCFWYGVYLKLWLQVNCFNLDCQWKLDMRGANNGWTTLEVLYIIPSQNQLEEQWGWSRKISHLRLYLV